MAEQSVTLAPGESKAISFEATPHEARTFQVSVNGLTGSFKAVSAIPDIIVDFDALSVLDVEGIEFTSVGMETTASWEAFGECLETYRDYIKDGVGLAQCMETKNPDITDMYALSLALYQCGLRHPEYLTSFAKSIPPPERLYCTPEHCNSLCAGYPHLCYTTIAGEAPGENILCIRTWTCTWWERAGVGGYGMYGWCRYCMGHLREEEILTATLAEPIEMSKIRGVSLSWLNKTIPTRSDCGTIWILQYKPTFSATMPPPGFRLISLGPQAAGEVGTALITGCYAGGYYYPGIYDGIVTVSAGCNYRDGDFVSYAGGGQFMIKNLARVTGTGTVVPPGY